MNAMLARALQLFLILIGVLLLLAILFPGPASTGHSADTTYLFGTMFGKVLDLTLSFLCFVGAYRISRWRKKKAK